MAKPKILPPGMKLGGMDLSKLGVKPDKEQSFREYTGKNVEILFGNQTELFRRTKDLLAFLNTLNENIIAIARMQGMDAGEFIHEVYNKEKNLEYMKEMEVVEAPYLEARQKEEMDRVGKELEAKAEDLGGEPNTETKEALNQFAVQPIEDDVAAEEPKT